MGGGGIRLIVLEAGETGPQELGQKLVAGLGGGALLAAPAAGDLDEGVADVGQQGEGNRELLKLGGVPAVLERVEVAPGGASAGSPASPRHGSLPSVFLSTDDEG